MQGGGEDSAGAADGVIEYDKGTNTYNFDSDNDLLDRQIILEDNGSIKVTLPNSEEIVYDPQGNVSGLNDIVTEFGSTIVNTVGGATAQISEDGTISIQNGDIEAEAIPSATGITVIVNGVTYEYGF